MSQLKLVIFDLGETLFHYDGVGLNWASESLQAWTHALDMLGVEASAAQIARADAILEKFNTRSTPREREYPSAHIFGQALASAAIDGDVEDVAKHYFGFFKTRIKAYPDSASTLAQLRASNVRLAALTDVPYGMSRALVREDLVRVELLDFFDDWLTSVDAGYRKPHRAGYLELLSRFGVQAHEAAYVGNEQKDVKGALAANMTAVLIDRDDQRHDWGQCHTVRSLAELQSVLQTEGTE